jgi:core-2/I-Branching enzyme
MNVAYLVLAHNNPAVLERSVAMLSSDNCNFFIHIDRKSDLKEFSAIHGDRVHFSDTRLPLYWGEFSLVRATLLLLRSALASSHTPDYCVLMSGTDFPLRSGRYVETFLAANRGSEFINVVKLPAPGKPLSRINTLRFSRSQPFRHLAGRAWAKLGLPGRDYRNYLGTLEPYSGSQWWALSREACEYILEFIERNPRFVKFFENVFAADEAFFHTILANSPFQSRIWRNLVYEDWSAEGAHPAPISERDVAFFQQQNEVRVHDIYGRGETLFARKFSDASLGLVRQIEEMIARKEGAAHRGVVSAPQETARH